MSLRGAGPRAARLPVVVGLSAVLATVGLTAVPAGAATMIGVTDPSSLPMLTSPAPTPEVVPVDSVSSSDAPPLAGDRSWVPKPAGKGQGFDATRSTAVASLTTDRREVFANPDGSFTARISPVPVRVPDGAGGWRPVDLALRDDGQGDLVPGASLAGLTVPTDPKQGMGRVTTPAGVVSVGLPDVAAEVAAPKVDTAGARFAGVAGGPSVLVAPTVHGFESSVVFDSAGSAKASYQVTVTLPDGVSAKDTGDGVVFVDRAGATLATAGNGVARDATHVTVKAGGVEGSAAVEAPLRVRLVAQVGAVASLEYAVDPAWLADPSRVFPVVLDPSFSVYAANSGAYDDTYVNAWDPAAHNDSLDLWAGTYGLSYSKSLMYFDLGLYAGADVAVTDSNLTVYGEASVYQTQTTCYAQNQIELYALGAAFAPTTQWSNQPATDGKAPWRSQTMPTGDPNQSCAFGAATMNVTALVQAWMRTGRPDTKANFGLQLRAPDGDPATGVLFYSGETIGAPRLDVTYLHVPDATAVAPADKTTVGVTTPSLQVSAPSSNANLVCLFRIANGNDAESGVIAGESGWQACAGGSTWTVPADTLTDGQTYSWHTWTRDSTSPAAMVMAPWVRTFTVNRRFGTSGPSPFDAVGPVSVNLATGNVVYQTSSPSFPTVAGSLGVSYTYNSLRRPTHGLMASYFNDPSPATHLSGTPVVARTESRVSHAWGAAAPTGGALVRADQFSTRWTGYLTVPTGGAYQLGGSADDGFRVQLDTGSGLQTILNQYNGSSWPTRNYSPAITLTANVPYKVEVDYYEATGNAYISFEGKGPNGFDGVIPSGWLTPDPPALPGGWSIGPDLDGKVGYVKAVASGSTVALTSPDGRVESWTSRGTGWVPPAGADGVLTGTPGAALTLAAADGQVYAFGSDGELVSITSASELKKPTGAAYAWTQTVDGLNRLYQITDPVSARAITLTYGTGSGTDPCPTNGTSARPRAGMLCKLDYAQLGGGQTSLYYNSNGQLGEIEDPGSERTDFAYDTSGRLWKIKDPLAADMIAAAARNDDATAVTAILYKPASDASYPSWATSVMLPAPVAGAAQPTHTYGYTWFGVGVTDVHVAGASEPNGAARTVWYSSGTTDDSRRMLRDIDEANLSTIYTYDDTADAVATATDPAGFESTTIFDARQRPIESYGPAPSNCYGTNNKPLASLPSGCPNPVPKATTAYDEGVKGLAATYWSTTDLGGAPKAMVTGVGEATGKLSANWGTSAPNPEVGADNWSARYSGDITFTQTGQYTLRVNAADTAGVKLSVDGTQIASHWSGPNRPEVVSPFTNHLDVFMRGPDDALWHRSWDAVGGQWSEWDTLGGVLTSDPGACVRGTTGRIDVFVRGTDNGIWQRYLDIDGWHPWLRIPDGVANGAPDCASWDTNHVALFVRGTDDALYVNRWTGGPAWTGFTSLGGTLTSDPAAVSWGTNRYDVFVRGAANALYHEWSTNDGGSWYAWENQGGTLTETPAVAAWGANRLDVFVRDSSNALEHKFWDGTTWSGYELLGGTLTTAPGAASMFPTTLAVFTRGTDDFLYQKDYNTTWGAWQAKAALFRTGKFTVTDASKPYRISVELADRGGTASVGLQWQAPGGSMVDVPGAQLNARYGLVTSHVDPDGRKVATSYTDQSLDPALGLPTAVRADPAGLNLSTRTQYETTYYRRTAKALPKGDLTNANKRITVTNYLGTGDTGSGGVAETRSLPTDPGCAPGTNVNQGGLPKTATDPMPTNTATQTWHETIYDPAGRIAATREHGDSRWTCTLYDARGRATDTTDRAGNVIHTQYWGAPADATCATVLPNVTCTRDVDSAGTTRSTRTEVDLLGQVTKYTDEQGTETTTKYDQTGRPIETWRKLPAGTDTKIGSTAYDTYNRVQTRTEYVSATAGRVFTIGYDTVGRPTTLDRPTTTFPVRTTTAYDTTTGRLASLTTTRNGLNLWNAGYGYSSAGKMTVDWSSVVLHQFTYDAVGRLVTATGGGTGTRNYAFDANTNRCANTTACTTPTFTYDNADRLTAAPSGTVYVYDARGNLTSYTKTGGGTVTLQYDTYDHATRIDDGTIRVDETLAPSGRVLRRTVTSPPGGTITEDTNYGYLDGGDSPGWARATSGGNYTTYLVGDIITGATPSYQITNAHGDIIGTTTQAGTFTVTPSTDEYGIAAGVPSTRLGWLGGAERFTTHTTLGIIRMGQRLYNPNLGRFLQQDPIEGGSANDYDYVGGDPVNALDLAGTFEYTLDFDLGSSSLSASQYMSTVAANFSSVFPIRGAPRTLPRVGSRVGLRVGKVPFPVTVTKRGSTGWTFGTRAGHPDFPGWVSFSFHKSRGRMHLRVHAYVPDYSPASIACGAVSLLCFAFRKRIYRGVAGGTWRPFANNLRGRVW